MSAKDEKKIMKRVADSCSTNDPFMLEEGELHPEHLLDFIIATTAYGGWKKPLELRDYQMKPAWDVIQSLVNGKGHEITAMFARQTGKTTSISGATNYFITALPSVYKPLSKTGVRTGIFGPKKEQADYAFDMFKLFIDTMFLHDYLGVKEVMRNTREVRLSNGSRVHCESASKNASIERLTLDVAILEEAQKIDDTRILNSIYPMCASTNGTRVLIGTPTPERSGYFYKMSTRPGPHLHIADWRECARYSKHYESFVKREMKRHGVTSDYFKTQYELEWISNVVNLCTLEELTACKHGPVIYEAEQQAIAGLDTGRINDSTVLTIFLPPNVVTQKPHIAMWAEWIGDDYPTQAKDIIQILSNFPNLLSINVDVHTIAGGSYGITDLLPSTFPIIGVPMKSEIQSQMWSAVRKAIRNNEFTYPDVQETERYKFEEQMTMLKTSHSGGLMRAKAPSGHHDDYADSFALAWKTVAEIYYIGELIYDDTTEKDNSEKDVVKRNSPRTSMKKPHLRKPHIGKPRLR